MGGEARDARLSDEDLPRHWLEIDSFSLGRFPVMNAEYWLFLLLNPQVRGPLGWTGRSFPDGLERHPVTGVSWWDARAYCEWLADMTGEAFRLPSEAEWEFAARGPDGRRYPWGPERPEAGCCNFGGRHGATTPAGLFSPAGDSPFGCVDMAGNVWEWTSSRPLAYPYDPLDGREDPDAAGERVVRGGAFNCPAWMLRASYRGLKKGQARSRNAGFRVALFHSPQTPFLRKP